jgi:hypothetical protein
VTINVTNDDNGTYESVVIGPQILRVYRSFTSLLQLTISLEHFPVTALRHILRSYVADTSFDNVPAALFGHAGLLGDDPADIAANVANVTANIDLFRTVLNELAGTTTPTETNLGGMVDVALVAIGLTPMTYDTQGLAQDAADDMVENGSMVTVVVNHTPGTGSATFTLTSPDHMWVSDPFAHLEGTLTIESNADLAEPTVGDTLAAVVPDLLGASGVEVFVWRRDGVDIDLNGTGPMYELVAADVDAMITVELRDTGSFGILQSAAVGPVLQGAGTDRTFTLELASYDNAIAEVTGPALTLAAPNDSIELTGAGALTGIQWFVGGLPHAVAEPTILPLDASVHGNRIGTHRVTVHATMDGRSYSRIIVFTVAP